MSSDLDEIILEIEDTPVICKKHDLIVNSDYFKVMLEGDFIEKDKRTIKLEGVDLKAMNIILTLLWDETYTIEDEDILMVLQAACMLQFVHIAKLCQNKIIQMLYPKNCVKIWLLTEQLSLKPLYLKAKTMALEEFVLISDMDCLLELNLEQIYNYLGHINLRTDNEFIVFQTVMKWWYENSRQFPKNSTSTLLKLLSCIDYKNLSNAYLKEMMTYPDIDKNNEIKDTLLCLYKMKNKLSTEMFSESCRDSSRLLFSSKSRISASFLCILVQSMSTENPNKKTKMGDDQRIAYYDNYKRKRFYKELKPDQNINFHIIYHDHISNRFKKFLTIDNSKCQSLEGFKLLGYKEYVFMYGGEFVIGRGSWNTNLWAYDTIREKWERKSVLPYPRRHFETCIVDSKVFIIGGTGRFRVTQENFFWYDFQQDEWSKEIPLPFYDRQLKCCHFLNKYFVLSINDKCGYFYTQDNFGNWNWVNRPVVIEDDVLNNESVFGLFSFKDKLYIKGKNLMEFGVDADKIVLLSIRSVASTNFDELEVTLCYNTIYTLYKYRNVDSTLYTLEKYNLETGDVEFIFRDVEGVIEIDGEQYTLHPSLKIFSFNHYSSMENHNLINTSFCD